MPFSGDDKLSILSTCKMTWSRGYKTFFVLLKSSRHEISTAHRLIGWIEYTFLAFKLSHLVFIVPMYSNVKMLTIVVGILTFTSLIKFLHSWVEREKKFYNLEARNDTITAQTDYGNEMWIYVQKSTITQKRSNLISLPRRYDCQVSSRKFLPEGVQLWQSVFG